jgi:hypothetical protein
VQTGLVRSGNEGTVTTSNATNSTLNTGQGGISIAARYELQLRSCPATLRNFSIIMLVVERIASKQLLFFRGFGHLLAFFAQSILL